MVLCVQYVNFRFVVPIYFARTDLKKARILPFLPGQVVIGSALREFSGPNVSDVLNQIDILSHGRGGFSDILMNLIELADF